MRKRLIQDACQLLAIFSLSSSSLPLCSLSFLAFCAHTRPLTLSFYGMTHLHVCIPHVLQHMMQYLILSSSVSLPESAAGQ